MEARLTGMAVTAFIVAAGLLTLVILKRKSIALCAVTSILAVLIGCISLCTIYALYIEPSFLTVTERTITSSELPPSFDGKKVAYISDIHIGKYYKEKDFARLVGRINELHPDILLIGGDIVDRSIGEEHPADPVAIGTLLKSAHAPLGIYAVEGNHDIEDRNTRAFMQKVYYTAGIKVLLNQNVLIRFKDGQIAIAGLKESYFHKPDADAAYKGIPERTFTIGLVHQPDYATEFVPHKTPLVLAGHSHGGVVVLPYIGSIVKVRDAEKMVKGIYKVDGTEVYVSNGIGFVYIKARLAAPPEIVVYTLSRGNV